MWQMWRFTFFVTEKSDKCDVTQISDGKLGRNPGKTDPKGRSKPELENLEPRTLDLAGFETLFRSKPNPEK